MTTQAELAFLKCHGFDIEPTYDSRNGTQRKCNTVQGWRVTRWDGKQANWLGGSTNWYRSKQSAVQEIKSWYADAHEGADLQRLKGVRPQYLNWLLVIWPEAQHVRAELARREEERVRDEAKRKEQEKAERKQEILAKAAPSLLETLKECVSMIEYVLDDGYHHYEGGKDLAKAARAAIREAEGSA